MHNCCNLSALKHNTSHVRFTCFTHIHTYVHAYYFCYILVVLQKDFIFLLIVVYCTCGNVNHNCNICCNFSSLFKYYVHATCTSYSPYNQKTRKKIHRFLLHIHICICVSFFRSLVSVLQNHSLCNCIICLYLYIPHL